MKPSYFSFILFVFTIYQGELQSQVYCNSAATDSSGYDISIIQVTSHEYIESRCHTLKNFNGFGTATGVVGKYSNWTAAVPSFKLIYGNTYFVNVVVDTCNSSSQFYSCKLFIDWNADGDFLDTLESTTGYDSIYGNSSNYIQIPNIPFNTIPYSTRMRIVVSDGKASSILSCGNYSKGETEDYNVDVSLYCPSYPNENFGNAIDITVVKFNDSVNFTSCNSLIGTIDTAVGIVGRYSDFASSSSHTFATKRGDTIRLKVGVSNCISGAYNSAVTAFIDWNQDYDFIDLSGGYDINERIHIGYNPYGDFSDSVKFVVPTNAKLGKTRLRVVYSRTCPNCVPACNSYDYGETEDYNVFINNHCPYVASLSPNNKINRTFGSSFCINLNSNAVFDSIEWFKNGIKINSADTAFLCFNSAVYNDSGNYFAKIYFPNECIKISDTTIVKICDSQKTYKLQNICDGEEFNFGGKLLNISGVYFDTLTNTQGCDSIIVLTLLVNYPDTTYLFDTICSNQSFSFNNKTITTSGIYWDTLATIYGCDSFIELALTVIPIATKSLSASICAGTSYYFNNRNLNVAGIYLDTFFAANGCDSIVTLNLTIKPTSSSTINSTICKGMTYLFNGVQRSTSGTFLDTFTASNGCDSFVTLNLTISSPPIITTTDSSEFATAYTWRGKSYSSAGTYYDTSKVANKCDTIFKLILTTKTPVPPAAPPILQINYIAGALIASIDSANSYQWYLCGPPMKKITGATKRTFQVSDKNKYTVVVTKNGKTDTAACASNSSIVSTSFAQGIICYPNPVFNKLTIELERKLNNVDISIYDLAGRILWTQNYNSLMQTEINMQNFPEGTYFLQMQSDQVSHRVIKIVKRDE